MVIAFLLSFSPQGSCGGKSNKSFQQLFRLGLLTEQNVCFILYLPLSISGRRRAYFPTGWME
jgi:hypothetical protein